MSECASDACEKMCPLIASLEQFQANQAKLQSIYKDTLSLVESNQSLELPENFAGSLDADQLQNILDKNKNSVHILGESYATKCRCLNWMLCENILPTHCEKWLQKRHQVVVKHGANHQLAVTLPDNYLIPVDKVFSCSDDIREYLTGTSTISEAIGDGTVGDLLADVNSNVYGIEVLMGKSILSYGLQVTLHNSSGSTGLSESSNTINDGTIPLFICAMDGDNSNNNAQLLQTLKRISPTVPVLLWFDSDVSNKCLKRKQGHLNNSYNGKTLLCVKTKRNAANSTNNLSSCLDNGDTTHTTNSLWNIEKLLQEMQYDVICAKKWTDTASDNTGCEHLALYCDHLDLSHTCNVCQVAPMFTALIRSALKYFLANASTVQNSLHHDMLESTISKVYSLSRDVLITPKRIEYAQCQERLLYKRLLDIATHNQLDIMDIISSVKVECAERIMQLTESYDAEVDINGVKRPTTILSAAKNIQNFVLQHVKLAAAEKLNNNINVLRNSVTGTLSRCLMHLETFDEDGIDSFVSEEASQHLKMILNAAYNVEINVHSSSSLLSIVLDKIRQMFYSLSWRDTKTLDSAWKCKVAEDVLDNLCESRLAKHMCSQFRTQLSEAHEHFVSSLQHLQQRVQGRLDKEEAKKHHASKILAPQIAQLALRSRSLIDELQYGMPKMGKELGRGMYGVVFACSPWGKSPKGPKRCAVKSVVPHDEKHWNDLALEFYYSISLPPHPRIVELYGSVIDHSYGGGSDQAVLLVMERMNRDLHCAIKRGLSELVRMSIGIDVIEGIRYLHSQGLVHRDIKLKNILLDGNNRAKISDLGFCKPSAMMSGSIVGTPIHMPPELFSGQYDNSVDVYAFGVLFWHLCAASVHIPIHYRNCVSKDHLWTAVRKGTRPEYLTCFRDDCWVIMTECWHQDATKRPLPGILHEKLIRIHHKLVVT